MRRNWHLVLVAVLVVAAPDKLSAARTPTVLSVPSVEQAREPAWRDKLAGASVERYPDFRLAVVEFHDNGLPVAPLQFDLAISEIEATSDASSDAVFILYVHGWGHNGSAGDPDLQGFRETLQRLAENELRGRGVMGIYVGWDGRRLPGPLRYLTFVQSSSVADSIIKKHLCLDGKAPNGAVAKDGCGSKRELLRLDEAVKAAARRDPRVVAVSIGHSLGGKFLFAPMEAEFDRARSVREPVDPSRLSIFGSLVILVNPAQDTYDYEPFAAFNNDHPSTHSRVVTFSSENDWVVGTAFKWGRAAKNLFRKETWGRRFKGERTGIGWDNEQVTHVLCSTLTQSRLCDPHLLGDPAFSHENAGMYPKKKGLKEHGPFQVVRVDQHVLPGHGHIFNPVFVAFLRGMIAHQAQK